MVSKIDKKGNHELRKYFEGDGELNKTQKLTKQKLDTPEKLDKHDVENLCSKFLVNMIYYEMAKKQKREEALQIAAAIILNKGAVIKDQLDLNDLEIKKAAGQKGNNDQKSVTTEAQNLGQQPAEKADIIKISGGTLSEVIAKITEMLAGKSGTEFKNGANNFSAMIEILSVPEIEEKFAETMKFLAKDPVLVADIKNILEGTKAADIFDEAIQNNFSNSEKKAVDDVTIKDLQSRRQENIKDNKNIFLEKISGNQR